MTVTTRQRRRVPLPQRRPELIRADPRRRSRILLRHMIEQHGPGRAAFYPTATQRTVITYAYDPLYRLTQANATGVLTYTFEYDYDAVSNHTVQTRTVTSTQVTNYVYDAANRLTNVNGQSYTWDDNGNLVNDGEKTYTYNQANRLAAIEGDDTSITYLYSGDGARLQQIVNGSSTTYALDLAAPLVQVLMMQDAGGKTAYLYGVTRIGEQQTGG